MNFIHSKSTLQRPLASALLALSVAASSTLVAQNIDLAVLGTTHPGFVIKGIDADDQSGRSVSGAGDVNGDGLADLIVGADYADPNADSSAGESYVVFGKTNGTAVDLNNLGTGGFRIDGIDAVDRSGFSVSGAGDVNGDGLADLIVGAFHADPNGDSNAGESYVVFGKTNGTTVDLNTLGTGGFRIDGIDARDISGSSVSGAGDVNGDGLADLIVGALFADPNGDFSAGESYVVFGKTNGTAVDLNNLGTGGFRIDGIDFGDYSGRSVSGAGDVNGDGLADLIVEASFADPNGNTNAGESYVVFGKTNGTAVDLNTLGTGGFRIDGIDARDHSGSSASGAGDVNGDGLADLIVGAPFANPNGNAYAGVSYVVFGKTTGTAVDLNTLGTGGFRIDGIDVQDRSGSSVSGAGDVNGDGFADLIVGAYRADPNGDSNAGESYVVFGKTNGTAVDLENLGTRGYRIDGIDARDYSGRSVSGAGDVNGDGLADLIVGAYRANPNGDSNAGESYVIFSAATPPASATYFSKAIADNAPRQAISITGDGSNDSTPDSRAFIDFADGANVSTQTVTLNRTNTGISNLSQTANVLWQITSTRKGWTSAEVTFRYTDAEIAGLLETSLKLYQGTSPEGPWRIIPIQTLEHQRNQITGRVSKFGFFAVGGELGTMDFWMAQ